MAAPRRDLTAQITDLLSAPVLNAVIGAVGVITPVVGWFNSGVNLKVVLGVETVLLLLLAASHIWLRSAFIQLRRANAKDMADARYFDLVRDQLEQEQRATGCARWPPPSPSAAGTAGSGRGCSPRRPR